MYRRFVKRILDFLIALCALTVLSPILLILIVTGAVAMGGNPFFTQLRPGKNGKIFRLIKFRSMTCEKDEKGELLPDDRRLNAYGRFLRSTSLDELPELINILIGQMSLVGPRPLAVRYLPYYTEEENRRHSVLPGLTGLAQVNGRNCANWPDRFAYDLQYVDHVSLRMDLSILLKTVIKVLKRSDVVVRTNGAVMDFDRFRILQNEGKINADGTIKDE